MMKRFVCLLVILCTACTEMVMPEVGDDARWECRAHNGVLWIDVHPALVRRDTGVPVQQSYEAHCIDTTVVSKTVYKK